MFLTGGEVVCSFLQQENTASVIIRSVMVVFMLQ